MKKFFVLLFLLFGLIILILIGGCQNSGNILPFPNGAPVIISEPIINYSLIIKPEGMSINTEKMV
jgi:uncharacterized lipoprotein YajG